MRWDQNEQREKKAGKRDPVYDVSSLQPQGFDINNST